MTALQQLSPPGPEVDARTYVEALDWTAPDSRPRVLVNLVASLDGHVAVDGRSRGLTDPGDRALFHALRGRVDGVLAGGPTLVVERYGRLVPDPARRSRRAAGGRAEEPLAVIISRSGSLPDGVPLLEEPSQRVVAFLGADSHDVCSSMTNKRRVSPQAHVSLEPYDPMSDAPLTAALGVLRERYGVETLLCEGGPTLAGALIAEGVVDDLFLTLSPRLVGGPALPSLLGGDPLRGGPTPASLGTVLAHADTLFLRYALGAT